MFNHLESRLNRLRKASHLDAQISKFSSVQKPGTEKQFAEWCVYVFEAVGKCKIEDFKMVGDDAFTFEGTDKKGLVFNAGLVYHGLTFEWTVNVGKSSYSDKQTLKSLFSMAQIPMEMVRPIQMGKF
jgi:hypothetical protein